MAPSLDDLIREELNGSTTYISAMPLARTILTHGGIHMFGYSRLGEALRSRSYLSVKVRGSSLVYKQVSPATSGSLDTLIERQLEGKRGFISYHSLLLALREYGGIGAFGYDKMRTALLDRPYLVVAVINKALHYAYRPSVSLDDLILRELKGKRGFITYHSLHYAMVEYGGIRAFGYEKIRAALMSRPYLSVIVTNGVLSYKNSSSSSPSEVALPPPSLAPPLRPKWKKRRERNWERGARGRLVGDRPHTETVSFPKPLSRYPLPPSLRILLDCESNNIFAIKHESELFLSKTVPNLPSNPPALLLQNQPMEFLRAQRVLLFIEELEKILEMNAYDQYGINPHPEYHVGRRLHRFDILGLAENRPSVLRSDEVSVDLANGNKHKGYVWFVNAENILVHFHSDFRPSPCDLHFHLNRTTFKLMHRALDDSVGIFESIQSEKKFKGALPSLKQKMSVECNEEQREAISEVANAEGGHPIIIFGPPGTGKTRTLIETLYHLLTKSNSRILICAPSNFAVDHICQQLVRHWPFGTQIGSQVFRMNGFQRNPNTLPPELKQIVYYEKGAYQLYDAETLKNFTLIASTCMSSGYLTSLGIHRGYFTHIIVDEAGQALLPECLVPLSLAGPKTTIVLAGDPNQLGPIIRSSLGKSNGFDISLLERWIQISQGGGNITFDPKSPNSSRVFAICKHYRAHPAIMGLYSKLFYNGNLVCHTPTKITDSLLGWENLKNNEVPILFRHVAGKEDREEDSPSWFNQLEINAVSLLLQSLLVGKGIRGGTGGWVEAKDVGVICPYRKQVEKMKSMIWNRFNDVSRVLEVGSTEAFQGKEKKVIIISCVRSSREFVVQDERFRLGFLSNPKRMNVAISRAQSLLVIVGNAELLSTADPLWCDFLLQLENLGVYEGPPLKKFNSSTKESESGKSEAAEEDFIEDIATNRLEL